MSIQFDPSFNPNYYNAIQPGNSHQKKTTQGVQESYALPPSDTSGNGDGYAATQLAEKLQQDFPNLSIAVGDYDFMTNHPLNSASLGSGSGNFLIAPNLLKRIAGDSGLVEKFEEMLKECEKSEEIEASFLSGLGGSASDYDSGFIIDDDGHFHGWGKPKPHTITGQTGPGGFGIGGFNPYTITSQTGPASSHGGGAIHGIPGDNPEEVDLDDFMPNMVQSRAVNAADGSHSILDKLADEKAEEINTDLVREADEEESAVTKLHQEEAADGAGGIITSDVVSSADNAGEANNIYVTKLTSDQSKSIGRLEQLSDLSRILNKLDEERASVKG